MTFLIDIGNVLLAFDFIPALESLKGKSPTTNAVDTIMAAKDNFEAGKTSLPEYTQLIRATLDFHESDEELFAAWNSIFTPIPEMFQLAENLKAQGHRLILFSNINPIHAPYCIEKYQLLGCFHEAVFSYEIGTIKPEDSFFRRAFEKHKIIPSETIYIDDMPENITAGKKHGLSSFCYNHQNHQELINWLRLEKQITGKLI